MSGSDSQGSTSVLAREVAQSVLSSGSESVVVKKPVGSHSVLSLNGIIPVVSQQCCKVVSQVVVVLALVSPVECQVQRQ